MVELSTASQKIIERWFESWSNNNARQKNIYPVIYGFHKYEVDVVLITPEMVKKHMSYKDLKGIFGVGKKKISEIVLWADIEVDNLAALKAVQAERINQLKSELAFCNSKLDKTQKMLSNYHVALIMIRNQMPMFIENPPPEYINLYNMATTLIGDCSWHYGIPKKPKKEG